jgi:hypothetical protein
MILTLLKQFRKCFEVSTPALHYSNVRCIASKSGGSNKGKKKSSKKSQEVGKKLRKDELDTAKEYIQRAKKSGKQIYKGVKDVITGKSQNHFLIGIRKRSKERK